MDGETIDSRILDWLWSSFQTQAPLRLYNSFRGVPINYDATITRLLPKAVTMTVHPHQAVCITLEKRTFIEIDALHGTVRAYPLEVHLAEKEVVLNRFAIANRTIGRRLYMRVQPREPLRVQITHDQTSVFATMADLSTKGIGIFTFAARLEQVHAFSPGDEITVDAQLPGSTRPVHMLGKVTHITQGQGDLVLRIGVQTTPNPASDAIVSSYILNRRNEIMAELDSTYQRMLSVATV